MDARPIDVDYAPASKPRGPTWTFAFLSCFITSLLVVLVMLNPSFIRFPFPARTLYTPLLQQSAVAGSLGLREVRISGRDLLVTTPKGAPIRAGGEWLTERVQSMPALLLVCVLTTLFAARLMGMKWLGMLLLAGLAALLVLLAFPALAGLLTGFALSLDLETSRTFALTALVRDAVPPLICALIAASWAAIDWAWPDSADNSPFIGRPWQSWAATSATAIIGCLHLLAGLGVLRQIHAGVLEPWQAWVSARYFAAGVISGLVFTLLIVALVRGRRSRSAWLWLCLLVPLGGDTGTGIVILLAALGARTPPASSDKDSNSLGNPPPGNV